MTKPNAEADPKKELAKLSIAKSAVEKNAPRQNKYRAKKTIVDGITFDSKAEANRYQQLKGFAALGMISNLEMQPRFDLHVNGTRIGFYKADFKYLDDGDEIIEDVKGMKTPIYNWKKRHMLAEYGIKIREVTK